MITTMTKYEIISLKLKGWSNSRIQKEFSVSRSTIRKYWDDYQEKLSELLKEDPSLDVRYIIEDIVSEPKYDSSSRRCEPRIIIRQPE